LGAGGVARADESGVGRDIWSASAISATLDRVQLRFYLTPQARRLAKEAELNAINHGVAVTP